MNVKEPMLMKDFADLFYDPEKTAPEARVVRFNVTVDFGDFTRRVTWKKGQDYREMVDTAKRGKCLSEAQRNKK